MPRSVTIFVPLLEEGTDVARPVEAEHLGGNRYRILGEVPTDELWAFQPGMTVICQKRNGVVQAVEDEGGDEAFWAEHDRYGDRSATRVPWWGCLLGLAIIGLAIAAIVRLIGG